MSFIVVGCAQINPLTGGVKDIYAPEIDSAKTYPLSGQTNFDGDEIQIKFKEYISLKNPSENIIITPQLKEAPSITSHNKKLTIEFNSELEANTTYTITFNHAVQDITEKNDSIFQFVFSTGEFIDSLGMKGQVVDAFTNKPEEGFLVALYPKAEIADDFDSIAANNKPTYIGQTDSKGNFSLNYLKEGEYFFFVFNDENRNLLHEPHEKIGFLTEQTIKIDTNEQFVQISTFQQEKKSEVDIQTVRFLYPGKLELIFNSPIEEEAFKINSSMELIKEDTESEDSLVYWLSTNPTSKMRFYTELNGEKDTLKPLYKGIPERGSEPSLKVGNNVSKAYLNPGEKLNLISNEPIASIDQNKIHIYDVDSTELVVPFDIINYREIKFETPNSGARLLVVDSAAIQTIYGNSNDKFIELKFETRDSSYFGSMTLNIDTLFETNVFIELLDSKGELVELVPFEQSLKFENLLPGAYQVRIIFDDNNDLEWTTGSIHDGRQPENVIYYQGEIKIKSKWEKEIDWNLKTMNDGGI